jgi:hypothetical protein
MYQTNQYGRQLLLWTQFLVCLDFVDTLMPFSLFMFYINEYLNADLIAQALDVEKHVTPFLKSITQNRFCSCLKRYVSYTSCF